MIGIFDSGVGGLTVAKEVMSQLPGYRLIYFGDTARYPYGNKSPKTVIKYAIEDTDFLLSHGAKVIIVGCNTASALAIDELKNRYPGVPIFGVVTPAVKQAASISKNKKVGVIGTRGTVNSSIYTQLINQLNPEIKVYQQACPLLVPLVEENWLKRPETKMIVRRYLYNLKLKGIDTLILGCTHYPLLKEVISAKIGKRVQLVDSAVEVVKEVKKLVKTKADLSLGQSGANHFYVSDLNPQTQEIAKRWLGNEIKLEEVSGIGE
ncbi:MAG: glutamate racemase [Patescibacteria group bacterium]